MFSDNVKKLPDAYYKGNDGNNYKLLHLNELVACEFQADMQSVLDTLDIEQVYGKTLDLYGDFVGQKRGTLTDDEYRIYIKNKMAQNICQGDINSILNLLSQIFDCSIDDISIEEVGGNKVDIKNLPLPNLIGGTLTEAQMIEMLERILPATVKIRLANIYGTFEFGNINNNNYQNLESIDYQGLQELSYQQFEDNFLGEYDKKKGFGNIEQTIGGYFGLLIQK